MLKVTHKVRVPFTVGDYVDEVDCDVLPLEACGLLLGRPWQYDRNAIHAGRANTYSFVHNGKLRTLKPMTADHIKSDVVLLVRKEKSQKAQSQPKLVKMQHEEHDAHITDERKDVAACITLPVCVDIGVQTDTSCADLVSVHRAPRVDGRCRYMRTPVRHFTGAAVRMHTGRDGHVRQLCGPGITHLLLGRAKQVHVQQHKVPARVHKTKVMAPISRRVWRRKEAPTAVPSRAGQVGGCGVVGRRDLKMAAACDVVDITTPFRAVPHALGTTRFEGGEDDTGMTEEVKPNFRTPPS